MTLAPSAQADREPNAVDQDTSLKPAIAQAPVPSPPVTTKPKWLVSLWGHKWLAALAVIVILALAYASFRHFKGTSVPVDVVQRADLIETVVASGHVESPFRVEISSQITGTVVSVGVREGETVRAGQQLILLSANELQSSALQAQAAVAQAAAQVRQLSELSLPQAIGAQNSAASSLLATQQVYDRAAALAVKGFVTRAYLDEVTKNRDVARTQVVTAAAQIRSAQAGGSDYATAQANLAAAVAGSSAARSRLGYTVISAPRSGILISRAVERGTVVTPGASLMVLSPASETQIVIQIDERNLGKIAVGQSALISADAYPNQRFAAAIAFINPGVDLARASATVKLTVPNPPAYLRQDMTVSVDVETARRRAVLSLPGGSIHDALSAAPWVMTVENGRAVRRPVRLGLQGNSRTEILGGMDVGAHVVPVASSIAVGARVSPIVK
jgi:HlyD family secretion protein